MEQKKINFSYWISFDCLELSEVALLLENFDPETSSFEEYSHKYRQFLNLLCNAVQAGKIMEASDAHYKIIKGKFTISSIVNFILESDFANDTDFKNYCKFYKLKQFLNETISVVYKDEHKQITKRDVIVLKILEDRAIISDPRDNGKEKDFIISRILNILPGAEAAQQATYCCPN